MRERRFLASGPPTPLERALTAAREGERRSLAGGVVSDAAVSLLSHPVPVWGVGVAACAGLMLGWMLFHSE